MGILFLCSLITFFWIYRTFLKKNDRFPPGPPLSLPIIGHLPYIGQHAHFTFWDWSKKYGKIIGVQLGSFRSVIIHDHNLIREAMSENVFSGRPDMMFINEAFGGKKGMFASDGKHWSDQKRFVMRNLLNFDFKTKNVENQIQEEVDELIDGLAREAGNPVSLQSRLGLAVLNVLWKFITGERYSHDDPRLADLVYKCSQFTATPGNAAMIFMPWLAKVAPELSGWKSLISGAQEAVDYFRDFVKEHKETLDENNPRDFVDRYLIEITKTKDKKSGFYGAEGEINLVANLGDLFTAGSETISVALLWAFLYISYYPEIQTKLQKEIDEVIGNRKPSLGDRSNMPYAEAVMTEVYRHCAMVPMSAFHNTMEDVEFKGYKIPKDTVVLCNNYASQYDPEIWGDPQNFRPERFLEEKATKNLDAVLIFSSGKRVCMGESLARAQFFLFVTSVYQRFRCEMDPTHPKPTLEPTNSLIMAPHPYKIVVHERNK